MPTDKKACSNCGVLNPYKFKKCGTRRLLACQVCENRQIITNPHNLVDFKVEETEPVGDYADEGLIAHGSCYCSLCKQEFEIGGGQAHSESEVEGDYDTLELIPEHSKGAIRND